MILHNIKNLMREWLPQPMVMRILQLKSRIFGTERQYANLSTADVFDDIYQSGAWGTDEQGNTTSGWGSHAESLVDPYISAVTGFLKTIYKPVVVDLGCGDFNVGRQLLPYAEQYIACDISATILERNKLKYRAENLRFRQLNLADDELPMGDVAFIRQVLQHLSNEEIAKFVSKMKEGHHFRHLVVTEHLPADPGYVPNRNKRTGSAIRIFVGSGVDLAKPPFNLAFKQKTVLLTLPIEDPEFPGSLVTTLYEMN